MLAQKGRDLANNCLVQILKTVCVGSRCLTTPMGWIGFTQKLLALLAVPNCGAKALNQLEITFLTLTPGDDQASLTIGELQCYFLYPIDVGIVLLTKQFWG